MGTWGIDALYLLFFFFQNNNSALSTMLSGKHNIYARMPWFDSWTLFANIVSHSTLYTACSQYISSLDGSNPLPFPLILSQQPWCPRGLHLVGRMHYLIGHQKIREEQLGTSRAGLGEENLLCNYIISLLWQLPLILRHRFKVTEYLPTNPVSRQALQTGVAETVFPSCHSEIMC